MTTFRLFFFPRQYRIPKVIGGRDLLPALALLMSKIPQMTSQLYLIIVFRSFIHTNNVSVAKVHPMDAFLQILLEL